MDDRRNQVSRRHMVAGAGTAGALVTAAALLPLVREPAAEAQAQRPDPQPGGGYRLTEHVKHYYRTTRI